MVLEKLLKIADSEENKEEFIAKIQEKYTYFMEKAWVAKLAELMRFTGIRPLEESVQKAYHKFVAEGVKWVWSPNVDENWGDPKLHTYTEFIDDSDAFVPTVRYGIFALKEVMKITGIRPELSDDIIQQGFENCVKEENLKLIKELKELVGVAPSENNVQELYRHYIRRGRADSVSALIEFTGIRPSDEIIEQGYEDYVLNQSYSDRIGPFIELKELSEGKVPSGDLVEEISIHFAKEGHLDELERFIRVTSIRPQLSEEVVHEAYRYYVKSHFFDNINKLRRIAKVDYDIPDDIIQDAYKEFIDHGWLDFMVKLRNITGVELPEDLIQKKYCSYVEKGQLYNINEFEKATGIKPKFQEDFVQDRYTAIVQRGVSNMMDDWRELEDVTGIRPSDEVIQEAYNLFVQNGWLKYFDKLKQRYIEPPDLPEEVIQQGYKTYAKKGQLKKIEELERLTGVEPSDDVCRSILHLFCPTK